MLWGNDEGPNTLQLVVRRTIRQEIMTQLHDSRTAGHLGRDKTVNRVRSRFYWPGMNDDRVKGYLRCIIQQAMVPLNGPLPTTGNNNQYVMAVSDYFSKWT